MFKNRSGQIVKRSLIACIMLISMFLFWHACSDSPSSSAVGDDEDDVVTTINCSGLELGAKTGEPVSKVAISGLGAAFGETPFARLYIDGDAGENDVAFIARTEGDQAELIVPFHPEDWREGGAVDVVIVSEDGQSACEGLPFYIEGLESSPETIEEELEAAEEVFSMFAESLGFDLSYLRSVDVLQVEARHQGLAYLVQAYSGENHPNNIRSLLDGSAPVLAELEGDTGDGEADELINAILNQAGFFDVMNQIREEFEQRAEVIRETREQNPQLSFMKADVLPSENSEEDLLQVLPVKLDILMNDQAWFAGLNSGYSGEIRDVMELTFGSLSLSLAAVGALPVAGKLSAAGVATSALGLYWSFAESVLPSVMYDIELEADPVSYNENQEDIGSWTATLEVHSNSWTLTWPDVLGLVPVLGPAGRAIGISVTIPNISPLAKVLLETFHFYWMHFWSMTAESGPYTVPAMVYEIKDGITPSRDGESDYFSWSLNRQFAELEENPFAFEEDPSQYHPVGVGRSLLEVRTNLDRFADQYRVSTKQLEVHAIEVEIRPGPGAGEELESGPPFYVQSATGEVIPFVAEVSNAEEYEIEWNLTGKGSLVRTEENEADYVAPDTERVDLLVAAVIASGGARDHPSAPRRSESVRIYSVESQLIVTPGIDCLELDTEQAFTAVLDGEQIDFSDLEWSITGPGTMSSNGVFSSGSEGEVTIEFRLRNDESITYEINFEVREFCTTPDLVISPVPVCLEPDERHQFNVLVNGQPVEFDSVDWVVSGPGSLGSDGLFIPSGTGQVRIEFWLKERPDVTKEFSFDVEEVCSYLRVRFLNNPPVSVQAFDRDNFEYYPFDEVSTCVSLESFEPRNSTEQNIFRDEAWMISTSDSDSFLKEIWINKELVLSEESVWTKTLWSNLWIQARGIDKDRYNNRFLSPLEITMGHGDLENYGWISFGGGYGAEYWDRFPLELSRTTRLVGNDVVQAYSGQVDGLAALEPFRALPALQSLQYFRVEFRNIMPEEFGCK